REVWWGLAALAGVLAIFSFFATLGWPGAADSCTRDNPNSCWCEDFLRAGALIKQPINTWGNLGFIAIGLAVLWQVGSDRRRLALAGRRSRHVRRRSGDLGAVADRAPAMRPGELVSGARRLAPAVGGGRRVHLPLFAHGADGALMAST